MNETNPLPVDLDTPVKLERPCKISSFKVERHIAQHIWDFCRANNCKHGQFLRLLVEKDLQLTRNQERQE